jgi:hypothetical protein
MFDKLILLSEGHPVYFGKANGAMDYYASIGLKPLIAMNPADFLLDIASGNVNDVSIPQALDKIALQNGNDQAIQPPAKDVREVTIITIICAGVTGD